jgi:thymidylate synthase
MLPIYKVADIRQAFVEKYLRGDIVTNDTGSLSGADTVEILGASFIADESAIFGVPNYPYIQNEIDWYISKSLNVNDIPGEVPKIWKAVASPDGLINSNYGYLIFSKENGAQVCNVIDTLLQSPSSRRATMIYTRPTMHVDFNTNGMQDFVCTNAVQYIIRNNRLHVIVQMRSNDAWAGFRNDLAWQLFVQKFVLYALNAPRFNSLYELGDVHWQVSSLHVYQRQFYLLDHFAKTGEHHITLENYNKLYK